MLMFLLALFAGFSGQTAEKPADPFGPMRLYDGAWTVTMHGTQGKDTTDALVNDCHSFGRFFACQQTVNGKVGALVIYTAAETPGHYYTQNVMADDRALGRGELTVEGSHWTYLGHDEENGKTTWYRTTNEFTGNDRIHFESAQSSDNKTWTVNASGDEVRGAKP